ncbi:MULTISPECIES: TonB-dependent receptor [unclassified Caulobacter]|uniref:TonB-dependent receptor n=1 Tax=unclassified Caulobacter TaxID=2648921 RepID=UPI0009EAB58D|nr:MULTISPECIES: TonB-dependent receptor [unclassified Caulobacter]
MPLRNSRNAMLMGASALVLCAALPAAAFAQAAPAQTADTVEEVVVTGQRAAIKSAQEIKKNATEIVDGISADDIGKLPDRSVTEALQRIVGVTIDHTMSRGDPEHFSVEGSGVNIRGLSYVRSELNGRDSFGANGGRALSFEDVPPELMAGVDIYKNPSAEQIEGAIGGLVNLRTQMPFDHKGLKVGAAVSGTYGDLAKGDWTPSYSALISNRWDTPVGEFGALIDVAYSESHTRTDGIQQEAYFPHAPNGTVYNQGTTTTTDDTTETGNGWNTTGKTVWVPNGLQWRTLDFNRKRTGVFGALQWRPSDKFETSLTYFQSKYEMEWGEYAIFSQVFNPGDVVVTNGQFDDKGLFKKGTLSAPGGMSFNDDVRAADRNSRTSDVSWHAQWTPDDKLTIKTDVQYVRATTRGFDSTVATGLLIPSEDVDLSGDVPKLSVDKQYMANPANYFWGFTMDHADESVGHEWAWRGDVEYKFDAGPLRNIRFGARYTDRDASTIQSNPSYNWQGISQTWMLGWYMPDLAYLTDYPAPTTVYQFPNFFNGKANLPAAVVFPALSLAQGYPDSYKLLHSFRADNSFSDKGYVWPAPAYGGLGSENLQDENTWAGYAQAAFGWDDLKFPVDGTLGVRVVKTKNIATGAFVGATTPTLDPSIPAGLIPRFQGSTQEGTFHNEYTDVLPSLNVRIKLTDTLQARFAAAKALARPDFTQLQAYTTISQSISGTGTAAVSSLTGTASGNPYLEPTRSNQFDATLEWYFAPTGSLTMAVFHKDLSDVVINQVYNVPYASTNGQIYQFSTTAPVNGADGKASGVELAYNQFYDFLPGWLSGFGLQANFTYVDSEQTVHPAPSNITSGQASTLLLNQYGIDTNGAGFTNLPLANLSKYSYNVALMYEKGPISARLAYNWRSKYLQAVNVNGGQGTNGFDSKTGQYNQTWGLPMWADDYGQLDGSLFYKVNDKVQLGVEAQNLSDSKYKQLLQQNTGYNGRAWFVSGRRYTATLRLNF